MNDELNDVHFETVITERVIKIVPAVYKSSASSVANFKMFCTLMLKFLR